MKIRCCMLIMLLGLQIVATQETKKNQAVATQRPRMHLRVAAEGWSPFLFLTEDASGIHLSGPMHELLNVLAEKMNFNYSLKRPENFAWGVKKDNGTWTGMIGMLNRTEVDIALGPFIMSPTRAEACDFSYTIYFQRIEIMTERPKLVSNIYSFLKPFSGETYIAIGVFLLVVTVAYKLISTGEDNVVNSRYHESFLTSILWSLRILFQEGTLLEPSSAAVRMLFIPWLMVTFILAAAYEGTLTALLTVPEVSIPIDSLEELVSQHKVPWRFEADSYVLELMKTSDSPVFRKVYEGSSGEFSDCVTFCGEIAGGDFIGICGNTEIERCMHDQFSHLGRCTVYSAKEKAFFAFMSIAIQNNSTYGSEIEFWLRRVKQAGLFDKWVTDQVANASNCLGSPSADARENYSLVLGLENLLGLFYFLLIGLAISGVVFVLELVKVGVSPLMGSLHLTSNKVDAFQG